MSTPPEGTFEITLRLERQTALTTIYSAEPWGFASGDLIRLSTIGLQQQFLGRVPKIIVASFKVEE